MPIRQFRRENRQFDRREGLRARVGSTVENIGKEKGFFIRFSNRNGETETSAVVSTEGEPEANRREEI